MQEAVEAEVSLWFTVQRQVVKLSGCSAENWKDTSTLYSIWITWLIDLGHSHLRYGWMLNGTYTLYSKQMLGACLEYYKALFVADDAGFHISWHTCSSW